MCSLLTAWSIRETTPMSLRHLLTLSSRRLAGVEVECGKNISAQPCVMIGCLTLNAASPGRVPLGSRCTVGRRSSPPLLQALIFGDLATFFIVVQVCPEFFLKKNLWIDFQG